MAPEITKEAAERWPSEPGSLLLILLLLALQVGVHLSLDLCGRLFVLDRCTHGQAVALRADNLPVVEVGTLSAATLHTMEARFKLLDILGPVELLRAAEGHVAQEKQLALDASRVLQALLEHVREVAPFAEHVAGWRCFWRRNTHALGQQAEEV